MSGRLADWGRIDRSQTLRFTFDGKVLTGHAGDTVASALLANGVRLVGRSFKYHRPRGILSAGAEEPSALVTLISGDLREPNLPATMLDLTDGMVVEPEPLARLASTFRRSTAFLHHSLVRDSSKTFMGPTRGAEVYEQFIRKAAGLAAR
jgi:sarcosine oxidase subunit alpha